jgi:NADH-quinone oxidoreductase subunit K
LDIYKEVPVPIDWYLTVGILLFCIGLYGVLTRRNAIAVLMSIELMLNACNVNLVAFNQKWGYTLTRMSFSQNQEITSPLGQVFAIFVICLAAAEVAIGLALIIAMYRHHKSVALEDLNLMKW